MTRRGRMFLMVPLGMLGMAAFITIGGLAVMYLWNWLLPPLFGWHALGFWQALAMLALCRILFGGFGLHGSGRSGMRRRMRERMEERCSNMSPEERERFRQRMRERWGFDPAAAPAGPASGEAK